MAITAAMVKELRDSTGAGMMDAKKALTENDGDMEAAVDWLRTKGLAKAAKKSGRTAAEGLVAVVVDGGTGVAVEVNSETDFVGKNAEFQGMVGAIAAAAVNADDVDALKTSEIDGKTVDTMITDKIATIGENMSLRRMAKISGGSVVSYVHNAATAGMGKIGVLVAMDGGDEAFGKQVAMHIAAVNPASLSEDDLDPAVVEKEKQVQMVLRRKPGPDSRQSRRRSGCHYHRFHPHGSRRRHREKRRELRRRSRQGGTRRLTLSQYLYQSTPSGVLFCESHPEPQKAIVPKRGIPRAFCPDGRQHPAQST